MNVILSHPQDKDAIWLYLALKKSNVPIEIVSPEELLMAKEWSQNINNEEDSFAIKTKKGLEITSDNLKFLFNRTQMANALLWSKSETLEKQYVDAEMNALMLSWLYQVEQKSNIYNPTVGYSLSGVYWSSEQWENAAYKSGFTNSSKNNNDTVCKHILVVGDAVITNSNNKELINYCLKLSNLAKTPLLEITVSMDEKKFISANPYPSLSKYGNKLITIFKNIIHEN